MATTGKRGRMKYEIWITDKSGIPTFIKEYPYKIQCWTWALMNGYITRHRHWYFKDERLEIKESEG